MILTHGGDKMAVVESRHLSEQICEILRDRIVHGELTPGQRLIEVDLAQEFEVSRTPVKRALDRLLGEGLVEIVPRRGSFVTKIDANLVREICEIRRMIETYAARQGMERITPEQLERMRALLDDCQAIISGEEKFSYHLYSSKNAEFHNLIVESAGNGKLFELYKSLSLFVQIARVRYLRNVEEPRHTAHEEHKLILKAYEERDSATLVELIDGHIRNLERELAEIAEAPRRSS